MVGWIWGSTAVMALGGLIALVPRRREDAKIVGAAATSPEPLAAARP